ncbi:MAG: hypothetical protein ICV83_03905 [Cytophagales bacterium]|nr:hypothetical protein [Cytophagales bacterium]
MKKPFIIRFDVALFSSIHLLLALSLLALPARRDGHVGSTPGTAVDAGVEDNAFNTTCTLGGEVQASKPGAVQVAGCGEAANGGARHTAGSRPINEFLRSGTGLKELEWCSGIDNKSWFP